MKPEEFDLFATLMKQRSGLILTRDKTYFLESRLLSVVRKYNLKTMDDLAETIRSRRDENMMKDVTETVLSGETSFFRDFKTFTFIRTVLLPRFRAARADKKRLRLWSAGTSSGQEAYSLAMLCADAAADLEDWKVDIIGTDLSGAMIARAKAGVYTQLEAQRGLPIRMLMKYFENIGNDKWQVKQGIRQMVQFRESNLLHDFGPVGVFDFVLCRNVLGSFDEFAQRRAVEALHAVMAPDAALLVGSNETIFGLTDKFKTSAERGLYMMASPEALVKQGVG